MSGRPPPLHDVRGLQANERTLLAWMRTSLAFISFGFGLAQVDDWLTRAADINRRRPTTLVAGVFVVLGVIGQAMALVRYRQVRRALLTGQGIPIRARTLTAFALLTTLLGLGLAVYILR